MHENIQSMILNKIGFSLTPPNVQTWLNNDTKGVIQVLFFIEIMYLNGVWLGV